MQRTTAVTFGFGEQMQKRSSWRWATRDHKCMVPYLAECGILSLGIPISLASDPADRVNWGWRCVFRRDLFEGLRVIRNLISHRSPSAVASATAGSCTAPTPTPVKTSQTYYHRNQQYSIVGLTNAAGTLVERYTYSAYGTLGIYAANGTVRSSSTYANRYTYTGREWDADLRLYHFRARWYDPVTGGFVSRDPLGYVDGMSLYRGYFGLRWLDAQGTTVTVAEGTAAEDSSSTDDGELCKCKYRNRKYGGVRYVPVPHRGAVANWDGYNEDLMLIDFFSMTIQALNIAASGMCGVVDFAETAVGEAAGETGFGPTDLTPVFDKWKDMFKLNATGFFLVVRVDAECCKVGTRSLVNPCWLAWGWEYEYHESHSYYHRCNLGELPNPRSGGNSSTTFDKMVRDNLVRCVKEALNAFDCSKSKNFNEGYQ